MSPGTTLGRKVHTGDFGDLPIAMPTLAPVLSDCTAAPTAAVPVSVVVPPVVHVVTGAAVRSADEDESGTTPRDPKPGRKA